MNNNRKGFTLVELVVVVAIIGILAALVVPSLMGYVRRSRVKAMMGDMKSIVNSTTAAISCAYSDFNYGAALTEEYNGKKCGVITNYEMKVAQEGDEGTISDIDYRIAKSIVETLEPNGIKFDFTKYSGPNSGAMGMSLTDYNNHGYGCPGIVLLFGTDAGIERLEYSNGSIMCVYDGDYNIYIEGEDEAEFVALS
ncbi:MAG: prepilin-type N-terminal cleavage/methylation domain-containing protein [Ruminococcus sp.]|nr:prepilin-type N-terminal cleavage/methylation domain-containing protein [Ruminococcus sp.]